MADSTEQEPLVNNEEEQTARRAGFNEVPAAYLASVNQNPGHAYPPQPVTVGGVPGSQYGAIAPGSMVAQPQVIMVQPQGVINQAPPSELPSDCLAVSIFVFCFCNWILGKVNYFLFIYLYTDQIM